MEKKVKKEGKPVGANPTDKAKRWQHNLNRWKKLVQKHQGTKLERFIKKGNEFEYKLSPQELKKKQERAEEKEEDRKRRKSTLEALQKIKKEKEEALEKKRVTGRWIMPNSTCGRMTLTGKLEYPERKLLRSGQLSWHWLRKKKEERPKLKKLDIWPPTGLREMLIYLGSHDPKNVSRRIQGRLDKAKSKFIQQEVRPLINPSVSSSKDYFYYPESLPEKGECIEWASIWALISRSVKFCPIERILDGLSFCIGVPTKNEEQQNLIIGEYSPAQIVLLVGKNWAEGKTTIVQRKKPDGSIIKIWDSSVHKEPVTVQEVDDDEEIWPSWEELKYDMGNWTREIEKDTSDPWDTQTKKKKHTYKDEDFVVDDISMDEDNGHESDSSGFFE